MSIRVSTFSDTGAKSGDGLCPYCKVVTSQFPDHSSDWAKKHCSVKCYDKDMIEKKPMETPKPTSTISKWNNINNSNLALWISTDKDSKVDRIDLVCPGRSESFPISMETLKVIIATVESISPM